MPIVTRGDITRYASVTYPDIDVDIAVDIITACRDACTRRPDQFDSAVAAMMPAAKTMSMSAHRYHAAHTYTDVSDPDFVARSTKLICRMLRLRHGAVIQSGAIWPVGTDMWADIRGWAGEVIVAAHRAYVARDITAPWLSWLWSYSHRSALNLQKRAQRTIRTVDMPAGYDAPIETGGSPDYIAIEKNTHLISRLRAELKPQHRATLDRLMAGEDVDTEAKKILMRALRRRLAQGDTVHAETI
jgi:DNA-directed RNA polymerase specialized sigma24 family protein